MTYRTLLAWLTIAMMVSVGVVVSLTNEQGTVSTNERREPLRPSQTKTGEVTNVARKERREATTRSSDPVAPGSAKLPSFTPKDELRIREQPRDDEPSDKTLPQWARPQGCSPRVLSTTPSIQNAGFLMNNVTGNCLANFSGDPIEVVIDLCGSKLVNVGRIAVYGENGAIDIYLSKEKDGIVSIGRSNVDSINLFPQTNADQARIIMSQPFYGSRDARICNILIETKSDAR